MECISSNNLHYSVPVSSPGHKKNETAVYRNPNYQDELLSVLDNKYHNLQEVLLASRQQYSNRPFLASCSDNPDTNFLTFEQAISQAQHLGAALFSLNYASLVQGQRFIGVYGANSKYWSITDLSIALYGLTCIPVYDTLAADRTEWIFETTKLSTLIVSHKHYHGIIELAKNKKTHDLKNIILMSESVSTEDIELAKSIGLNVHTFNWMIEEGKKVGHVAYPKIDANQIFTLTYTSGTTGNPKGAMLTHKNFISCMASLDKRFLLSEEDVHLSYLPYPHIFERIFLWLLIYKGAKQIYYSGNPKELRKDITAVKPTFMIGVPRVYNVMYNEIHEALKKYDSQKQKLITEAISIKTQKMNLDNSVKNSSYDHLFNEVKEMYGGRIKFFLAGGAPISKEVLEYLKLIFSVDFMQAYGLTEVCGPNFITHENEKDGALSVGGPFPNCEFKLKDVPEMNYFAADLDEKGEPGPRGEILMRGPCVFSGYYNQEDKTKEVIDNEGWFYTGDIGKIDPNLGKLYVIDRKKQLFKMSQGEYIAPEKLQNVYMRTEGISEIFVHGDSLQSYLVAVAVPQLVALRGIANNLKIEGVNEQTSDEDLCRNKELLTHLIKEMDKLAEQEKFNGLEKIKKLHLSPGPSLFERGIMTTTMKMRRGEAYKHFKNIIDELYEKKCQLHNNSY